MSAQVSLKPSDTVERQATGARRRPRRRAKMVGGIGRSARRLTMAAARFFRQTFARKTRFKFKLALAAVMLTAPVWGLNLMVAFLGHSVVFPFSPFFLRQKFAAVGLYLRHRPTCLVTSHEDTDLLVKRAEARHHIPRGLLAAVVQVESRGFPHRISAAGAMGPGQLMPETARELGVGDPFDTGENVDGAARLLAGHLGRFHNVRLAVAAYNAGAGAVHGHIPSNGQTPAYVDKVMHAYAELRPPVPSRGRPAGAAPGSPSAPSRQPLAKVGHRRRGAATPAASSGEGSPALALSAGYER